MGTFWKVLSLDIWETKLSICLENLGAFTHPTFWTFEIMFFLFWKVDDLKIEILVATWPHSHIAIWQHSYIASQPQSHIAIQLHSLYYVAMWLGGYVAMWLYGYVAFQISQFQNFEMSNFRNLKIVDFIKYRSRNPLFT